MKLISSNFVYVYRDILHRTRATAFGDEKHDIHRQLMKSYKPIPQYWFWLLLVISLVLAIVSTVVYNSQLQLPWWGVLLGCAIATVFTLPFGVLVATANQVDSGRLALPYSPV